VDTNPIWLCGARPTDGRLRQTGQARQDAPAMLSQKHGKSLKCNYLFQILINKCNIVAILIFMKDL
jgi:hypothetical protein